jgi:ketosteroid isomerase-like protein
MFRCEASMTAPETLVKNVVQAWGEANLAPTLEALDENIVWKSAATHDDGTLSFGGVYMGKASVITLLAKLSTRYFFQRYVAKEIVSNGEIVWGLFEVHGHYIPPGGRLADRKPVNFETAVRCKVRDDKIVEVQSFFDTASLLRQQGEAYGERKNSTPSHLPIESTTNPGDVRS